MTTFPITQVGWARACSGVTCASCSREKPRKGPPDAVNISFLTSDGAPARRHCARAECSESTGTIWPGAAASVTSFPPTMSDSLLARAKILPVRKVASVGAKPIEPVMPLITTSASVDSTSWVAASAPRTAFSLATPNCERWISRSSVFCPAAKPTTSKRSRLASMTSRAWVPIDPVDPRMITRRMVQSCHP